MVKSINIGCFSVILICFCNCSNVDNLPVIKFSVDSASILVKNIDKVSLLQLKDLVKADSGVSDYLKIRIVPSKNSTVGGNEIVPGTVKVVGDSLIFFPSEKFAPGNSYLVESYIGAQFGSIGNLLKGKGQTTVHPQHKILRR
ncbi:hypothetical protein ABIB40_001223 [Pedobacter sp. UYP30]|uniref:hypothetical protein n=1 Tax=Pedobacter sp. UYP30 TaxID=1756400 RepID=UPI00339837ED